MDAKRAYLAKLKKHIGAVQVFGRMLGVDDKQLAIHDQSKYSPEEMMPYARHYFGDDENAPVGEYERAWLHHIHWNPHHWEHWIYPMGPWVVGKNGLMRPAPSAIFEMPDNYALEMVADWAGASATYLDTFDMSAWLTKNIPKIFIHPETAKYLRDVLRELDYGSIFENVDFP